MDWENKYFKIGQALAGFYIKDSQIRICDVYLLYYFMKKRKRFQGNLGRILSDNTTVLFRPFFLFCPKLQEPNPKNKTPPLNTINNPKNVVTKWNWVTNPIASLNFSSTRAILLNLWGGWFSREKAASWETHQTTCIFAGNMLLLILCHEQQPYLFFIWVTVPSRK